MGFGIMRITSLNVYSVRIINSINIINYYQLCLTGSLLPSCFLTFSCFKCMSKGLAVYFRLASKFPSSHFSFIPATVTGVCQHTKVDFLHFRAQTPTLRDVQFNLLQAQSQQTTRAQRFHARPLPFDTSPSSDFQRENGELTLHIPIYGNTKSQTGSIHTPVSHNCSHSSVTQCDTKHREQDPESCPLAQSPGMTPSFHGASGKYLKLHQTTLGPLR